MLSILPAYYVAVAGITALSVFGVIHIKYSNLPSCLLFYRNYRLLGPDEAGGFYTAHFWSLAIEEHFYLIWPMLLIAVKPKRAGRVAFLLAMAVAAWRTFEDHFELFPGVLIPSNLLARTDAKVDRTVVGMHRRNLFSCDQAIRGGYSFFAALATHCGNTPSHREVPPAGYDRVKGGSHTCPRAKHSRPTWQLAGATVGVATTALDWHDLL
jgi:hypothetical protein